MASFLGRLSGLLKSAPRDPNTSNDGGDGGDDENVEDETAKAQDSMPTTTTGKKRRSKQSKQNSINIHNSSNSTLPPFPASEVRLLERENSRNQAASAAASSQLRRRSCSLSEFRTQLPDQLPSAEDLELDALEYFCHVCLLQRHRQAQRAATRDLEAVLKRLDQAELPQNGRVYTRLQLTSLIVDVSGIVETATEAVTVRAVAENDNLIVGSAVEPEEVTPEEFEKLQEQLTSLYTSILEYDKNHTAAAASSTAPAAAASAAQPTLISNVLEEHDMMLYDYHELQRLFKIHIAMARLRQDLLEPTANKQEAVEEYNKELESIFQDGEGEVPCELVMNPTTAMTSLDRGASIGSSGGGALTAPSAAAARKTTRTSQLIVDTALHQLDDLLLDNTEMDEDKPYSYARLQEMTRSLLLKWSESILDIPKLFKLGYGGVSAPVNLAAEEGSTKSDDDFSEVEDQQNDDSLFLASQLQQLHPPPEGVGGGGEDDNEPLPLHEGEDEGSETQDPDEEQENQSTSVILNVVDMRPSRVTRSSKRKAQEPTSDVGKGTMQRGQDGKEDIPAEEDGDDQFRHDDDDDDDDDDDSGQVEVIEGPPRKLAKRTSQSEDAEPSLCTQTEPFTDQELYALLTGVRMYGSRGHWSDIMENSNGVLVHRHAMELKEQYRNLERTNRISLT